MALFSDRVKSLRLERNLSLRQLSKLTDISPSAIHAYEMGKREASHRSLEALSDVFNCDIDYLLGKTDIKNHIANSRGYDTLYEMHKVEMTQLTKAEQALLDLFRCVPAEQQEIVLAMIRAAIKNPSR